MNAQLPLVDDELAPAAGFACILADPPWPEYGGGGRGAQNHYPLMAVGDIAALPVGHALGRRPAHLWLWVTNNHLESGLRCMSSWGFRYVSNVAWVKGRAIGNQILLQQGLGQYLRGAHELLLFGVRGSLPAQRAVPSAFLSPRGLHSRKPDEAFAIVEAVSPGPRVELFAREPRQGWFALGNQVSGGDIAEALGGLCRPGALADWLEGGGVRAPRGLFDA